MRRTPPPTHAQGLIYHACVVDVVLVCVVVAVDVLSCPKIVTFTRNMIKKINPSLVAIINGFI
jgi:hypothetical protein